MPVLTPDFSTLEPSVSVSKAHVLTLWTEDTEVKSERCPALLPEHQPQGHREVPSNHCRAKNRLQTQNSKVHLLLLRGNPYNL